MLFYFQYILTIFACLVVNVYSKEAPIITYISQEQTRDIGENVRLDCAVEHLQNYSVHWVKYDSPDALEPIFLSNNNNLIIGNSRLSLSLIKNTYTLKIDDVQESDAGRYECQVIKNNHNITADVELQVRTPPVISNNTTRSLATSEGESAELECYASGFPLPHISWRRENKAQFSTGGSIYRGNVLKFNSIQKDDRGTYYCVADNGVGRGARRSIDLNVLFAPVVNASKTSVSQALTYDADLSCHVEAYPLPGITWFKDDIEIKNDQTHRIAHFSTADDTTDTTLRITNINPSHYGVYTCKALNKLGSDEGQIELLESRTPVCPPVCGPMRNAEEP